LHPYYREIRYAVSIITNPNGSIVRFSSVNAKSVVANDNARFDPGQVYVGSGGDLKYWPSKGIEWITLTNVPNGSFLSIEAIGIHTDSTASDIVILY
jgi:hypothetical protein